MAEVHQFACLSYNQEQRYKDWKQGFDVEFKRRLEKRVNSQLNQTKYPAVVTVLDSTQKELNNISEDIRKIERIIEKYNTRHKTDIYGSVNESIVKFSIRLDRTIDVNDISKHQETRKGLHKRLHTAEKLLLSKIHQDTAFCPGCTY